MILFREDMILRDGYFNVWRDGLGYFPGDCHSSLERAISAQHGARPAHSVVAYRIRVKLKRKMLGDWRSMRRAPIGDVETVLL